MVLHDFLYTYVGWNGGGEKPYDEETKSVDFDEGRL